MLRGYVVGCLCRAGSQRKKKSMTDSSCVNAPKSGYALSQPSCMWIDGSRICVVSFFSLSLSPDFSFLSLSVSLVIQYCHDLLSTAPVTIFIKVIWQRLALESGVVYFYIMWFVRCPVILFWHFDCAASSFNCCRRWLKEEMSLAGDFYRSLHVRLLLSATATQPSDDVVLTRPT